MIIYNTFDNKPQRTLKPIETIMWHTIKGILADYYRQGNLEDRKALDTIEITVKPTTGFDGTLTTFNISPSPKGLYDDVKRLFKSFIPTMQQVQGTWKEDTKETVIIIKPFDLRLRHYSGLQLED